MKKLSKISFRNALNEDQMKQVVGGVSYSNCSSGPTGNGCDGLCSPSFGSNGSVTTYTCKMFYITGLGGGKIAACGCY